MHTHPAVFQSCVVGVPGDRQVERVKAFVVLKDQALATPAMEQELIDYCRSQLIKWSCPRNMEFRHELPKTRVGAHAAAAADALVHVAHDAVAGGVGSATRLLGVAEGELLMPYSSARACSSQLPLRTQL